jgi:molybdopterin molybdotransferase
MAADQTNSLRFGRKAITVEEAQQLILNRAELLPAEAVPLELAHGRRLAQSVIADHPVPHFRRSGMDGYAIRASDSLDAEALRPVALRVTEMIPCGSVPERSVQPGEAARIMTGAVVPEGADAVIMLEMTDKLLAGDGPEGDKVLVRKSMRMGDNITPIGQEIEVGELLLETGRRIGPGEAAILATFGFAEVRVHRVPRVAVFSTGSELLPIEAALEPGRIRGSNSHMLACQIREAGGEPRLMPILPDCPETVEAALLQALDWADILVTTGGVSVGDKDVLVELFQRWDGELIFNKVAMRPGSPSSFGWWRGKPLFALSGNPGASFVGFELFVRPYLKAIQGCACPLPRECTALLDADYGKGSAYPRYVRARTYTEQATLKVAPAGRDKSSIMVSIKDAECLLCIPAGGQAPPRGALVRVLQLAEA